MADSLLRRMHAEGKLLVPLPKRPRSPDAKDERGDYKRLTTPRPPVLPSIVHPRVADQLRRGLLRRVPGAWVSSMGRYKLKTQRKSYGYKCPDGYHTGFTAGKMFSVHALVLYAFDGLPAAGQTYRNHHDLNTANNKLANLYYISFGANIRHARLFNMQRRSAVQQCAHPVWSQKQGSSVWKWHESQNAAARAYGLYSGGVSDCLNGKQLQTGGVRFCRDLEEIENIEHWVDAISPNGPLTGWKISSMGHIIDSRNVYKDPIRGRNNCCMVKAGGHSY